MSEQNFEILIITLQLHSIWKLITFSLDHAETLCQQKHEVVHS
jgi:hypothetical protein